MARRIQFIAPVEHMRGNLSGDQQLKYPTNDNKAYDAPTGKQYATNYNPRYIGAYRAATGKEYFSVKTRHAVNVTAKSKNAMAILGGSAAIYAAIMNDATLAASAQSAYDFATSGGAYQGTIRQFIMSYLQFGLTTKQTAIRIGVGSQSFSVDNPWSTTSQNPNIIVSTDTLVKFWGELALNGSYFKVDGLTGITIAGINFQTLSNNTRINILGIAITDVEGTQRPTINGLPLFNTENGAVLIPTMVVANHGPYTFKGTLPSA